jgi:phasin family protein
MYPTPNQLVEFQKTQIDALQAFGSTVFQAAEKFSQLNVAASRELFQGGADAAQSVLAAKDPQEATAIMGTLAQPGTEKLIGYSRNVYSIASNAQAELSKIFEAQVAEGNRKLSEFIDAAAKSAPAGTEHAIGALKNGLGVAHSAFDAVTKAARQASEAAESNLVAAVAVAADAVKGKGKKAA